MTESLIVRVSRWHKALTNADTGPLIVAAEIVALADQWDEFKEEAGGLDCSVFLETKLSRNLAWFRRRHRAVLILGEVCRRTMNHEVACWVADRVPEQYLDEVKKMLISECRANNGNPLTEARARRRVLKIIGRTPRKSRECERCRQLEERIAELTSHRGAVAAE